MRFFLAAYLNQRQQISKARVRLGEEKIGVRMIAPGGRVVPLLDLT